MVTKYNTAMVFAIQKKIMVVLKNFHFVSLNEGLTSRGQTNYKIVLGKLGTGYRKIFGKTFKTFKISSLKNIPLWHEN